MSDKEEYYCGSSDDLQLSMCDHSEDASQTELEKSISSGDEVDATQNDSLTGVEEADEFKMDDDRTTDSRGTTDLIGQSGTVREIQVESRGRV